MITFELLRESGIVPAEVRFVNIDGLNMHDTHDGAMRQVKFRLEVEKRDDIALFQTGFAAKNDGQLCIFFQG